MRATYSASEVSYRRKVLYIQRDFQYVDFYPCRMLKTEPDDF
jgi:hypothetical protein